MMAITYIPVVGQFTYRASPASPAAGERVVFVAASDAIVDGEVITLPTKLAATLTSTGELPTGFALPTLPGGVYYVVHEAFSGAREDYTIFVQPSDTLIDLATVVPAVPPEPLVQYLRVQDIGVSVGSQAMAADHETRIDALEAGGGGGGGGGADLSDNVPRALGTAAAGTGTKASRDDHVHAMPTASDVGADASGAATAAVAAHVGAADPHSQYLKEADAATVATTGAYADLSGRPTLGTAAAYDVGDFDAAGAAASAQSAAQTYADNAVSSAVVGLLDDRGSYDASGNVFPSTGGSGSGGAVLKGDLWTVSVAGTLGGNAVTAGDVVRALIDTPGQTASNWAVTENNLGYVPEPAQTLVTQAEAEAGADTNRKAWSVLRVWQAIAAWWAASSAKTKLDGIAAGATVGADWNANLSNKPTLGTAAAKNIPASGDAAAGEVVKGDDSRLSDARTPTAHTHSLSALTQSGATTGQVAQWNGTAWVPATAGGGSPGGSNKQLQINNAGAFAGTTTAYWDEPNKRLSIGAGTSPAATMHAKPASAAGIAGIFQGTASQTGDLSQWRDNSGTVLGRVTAAGIFSVGEAYTGTGLWVGGASYHGSLNLRGDPAAMGQYGLGYNSSLDATFVYGYTGRKFALGMRDYDGTYRARFTFHDASGVKTWTHDEGINYVFGTTTGTKLGTAASQKLGFWGATAVVQPASASQAAITDTAGGTYTSAEQTMLTSLKTLVNQLRDDLVTVGIIKGSA